jgi:hypothetical protein
MKGWTTSQIKQVKKAKASKPVTSANALTQQVLRVLGLKGFKVWRQNNGGIYDPVKKVFRANSSTLGISDVIGFHKRTGLIIACEIKVGRDKLSSEHNGNRKKVAYITRK